MIRVSREPGRWLSGCPCQDWQSEFDPQDSRKDRASSSKLPSDFYRHMVTGDMCVPTLTLTNNKEMQFLKLQNVSRAMTKDDKKIHI